nr:uncharacterized protein LOC129527003 [Gorilla gorilla gorilla]
MGWRWRDWRLEVQLGDCSCAGELVLGQKIQDAFQSLSRTEGGPCSAEERAPLLGPAIPHLEGRRVDFLPREHLDRSHYVAQADLKLLFSSDPPTPASQSAGIQASPLKLQALKYIIEKLHDLSLQRGGSAPLNITVCRSPLLGPRQQPGDDSLHLPGDPATPDEC